MERNIKRNAGIEVQKYSISWFSVKNRLKNFVDNERIIIIETINVIRRIIIILWSCRKFRCSINGEFLFWKWIAFHIGITFLSFWLEIKYTLYLKGLRKFKRIFCCYQKGLSWLFSDLFIWVFQSQDL